MKFNDRMGVAKKVLHEVKRQSKGLKGEVSVGAYQNGREQGYSLSSYRDGHITFVCFAEHRSSDSIVVYVGPHDPMQSITDEMWKGATSFQYGEYEKAAKFILKKLA